MTQILPAPPPTLPHVVLVETHRNHDVLHLLTARHVRTGFVAATQAMARVPQPVWCPVCWPDGRCGICRQPSGVWAECAACVAASIDAEAAYDRAVEHGEAS